MNNPRNIRASFLLKFILATAFFSLLSVSSFSQNVKDDIRIRGIIRDSITQDVIGYATVVLLGDSSKVISAEPSDVNGKFTLRAKRADSYKIGVGFVGYATKILDVKGIDGDVIEVGDIVIAEGLALDEVVIVAQQPLVTATADKIIYNMEADPEALTSTTYEILRKVPMISIDGDDKVLLNGESNYKVLINGRSSTMMSKNFNEVIKSMPANSIKNIEVITNPSTKYDAEGVGGVINIITNKQEIRGFNGTVSAGADSKGGYNGGAYIAAQVGKFAVSANLNYGTYVNLGTESYSESENLISEKYRYSEMTGISGRTNNNNAYTSIEASYEIDSLNLITLSGWGYLGGYSAETNSTTEFWDIDKILSRKFTNLSDNSGDYGSISASLNYQKLFKKKDRSFTASYNIDLEPEGSNYTNSIDGELDYDSYQQRSENISNGIEHTAQLDFYDPIHENHQYEVGLKYILRQNISDTQVDTLGIDNQWIEYPQKINDMDYDQHIASVYGGYVFKHKKFTAKVGFRGELTFNEGVSKSFEEDILLKTKPLLNVVPYVNFSLMLDKGQSIGLSYTQRIQRPGIWYLNPFVNDSDPINIRYGNPELKSVIANSIRFNYRKSAKSWNLFVGANVSLSDNAIVSISKVDTNGVRSTTYENIGVNNRYRINASGSYRLTTILSVYANANVDYTDLKAANGLENSGFSFRASLGGNVQLWKGARFNLNAGYFGSRVQLQGSNNAHYYHSMGISQKFLKDKLTLSFSASNPFTGKYTGERHLEDPTFKTYSSYTYDMRSFRVGLSFRFGKMETQVKKTRRSISNDDKMSGGGGGASSGGGKSE